MTTIKRQMKTIHGIVSVGGRTALADAAGILGVISQEPIEAYYMGWKKMW